MKSLKIMVLLLCTVSFAHAQEIIVHGNTKLNTEFDKFKTFTFSQASATNDANELIKNSIKQQLEARGYQENSTSGDLIVSYQILDNKTRVQGYVNDNPTIVGGQEIREPKDTTTHTLEPGTLLISLANRKTSEVVWDGFASGVNKGSAYVTDEKLVTQTVQAIFEEFKYRVKPLEN